jgi:hypothetical protein
MDITRTGLQIMDAIEQLSGYNRVRYKAEVLNAQQGLLQLAEGIQQAAKIPIRMPDKVNKAGWAKGTTSHDKTTKRLLTGAEYATKAANKAEQAQRRQQGQAMAPLTKEDGAI